MCTDFQALNSKIDHNATLVYCYGVTVFRHYYFVITEGLSGLSMNILRAGDKSPVQRGFFTNSAGDLLPALEFLGLLYNFCNFVIIFYLM